MDTSLSRFICGIPKCELHIHIEGTLEPELMFKLAERNNVNIPYNSVEEVKKAYEYSDLQGFLDIYYESARVLIIEEDFYDLTMAYLVKAHRDNILHSEIFFDPQTHTGRGIEFSTVIKGITRALKEGEEKFGVSTKLIMCFLRDLDENSAMNTLNTAMQFKEYISAVGLDSAEIGNPPVKFKNVFEAARQYGFNCVAHAGEEGPAEYVWEAVNYLKVNRIDHGNRSIDDEALIKKLAADGIPLTMCPLSNLKLKVLTDLKEHPIKRMLDLGITATINSDDPAYFGGYINDNYLAIAGALNLEKDDIIKLAKNSFTASFLPQDKKNAFLSLIDAYSKDN